MPAYLASGTTHGATADRPSSNRLPQIVASDTIAPVASSSLLHSGLWVRSEARPAGRASDIRAASALTVIVAVFAVGAAPAPASASPIVLGSAAFAGVGGEGWGTSRPKRVYNGGDASGQVREIQWTSWGGRSAIGYGLTAIFKAHGGYYSQPVLAELRAYSLGKCTASGPRAYTHLSIRVPARPEAPLGPWQPWAFSAQKKGCASSASNAQREQAWARVFGKPARSP